MVSFLQSNVAIVAALLATLASTEAAYGRLYIGTRPSRALGSKMLTSLSGQSLFSRDVGGVMHDVDEIFETMLGGVDEMFYHPYQLQRMSRPSYFVQGGPTLKALTQSRAKNTRDLARKAYGITQDDKQLRIVVDVPGAKASDISLQLEEDGRLLRISSETKSEHEGISVRSHFERSFTLSRDIDTSNMAGSIDNGVLTISAPRYEEAKEITRRIDVTESTKSDSNDEVAGGDGDDKVVEASSSQENEEIQRAKLEEVDESVIDLDEE